MQKISTWKNTKYGTIFFAFHTFLSSCWHSAMHWCISMQTNNGVFQEAMLVPQCILIAKFLYEAVCLDMENFKDCMLSWFTVQRIFGNMAKYYVIYNFLTQSHLKATFWIILILNSVSPDIYKQIHQICYCFKVQLGIVRIQGWIKMGRKIYFSVTIKTCETTHFTPNLFWMKCCTIAFYCIYFLQTFVQTKTYRLTPLFLGVLVNIYAHILHFG